MNRVQTLRSSTPGNTPAAGVRLPGELWANFPDLQFGVIDASKNAQRLIAIRYFSTTANYAIGEFVVQAGALYVAIAAVTPGAFNVSKWSKIAAVSDIPAVYVLPIATTSVLGGVKPDGVTTKVDAGGVLTSAGLVAVATTPPATPQNGALWFDLVGGQLYAWVNDGTSSQWVIAVNQNISGGIYLPLAGGTLTGPLKIAAGGAGADGLQLDLAAGNGLGIAGQRGGSLRWRVILGNSNAESGGNAGSDFAIASYTDAGAGSGIAPVYISRASGAVQIYGTSINDNASVGYVGEVIASTVAGPGPAMTNAVTNNVSSIALTAGDWDIQGEIWVAFGTGGGTFFNASLSPNSGSLVGGPSTTGARVGLSMTFAAGTTQILSLGPCRASLAAPATYYLTCMPGFASGTTTAYGKIWARRAR